MWLTSGVRRTSLYEHLSSPVPEIPGDDSTVITKMQETHDDQGHDLDLGLEGGYSVITRSDDESSDEEASVFGLGYPMPSASTSLTHNDGETYDDDPGISRLGDPLGL